MAFQVMRNKSVMPEVIILSERKFMISHQWLKNNASPGYANVPTMRS